MKTTEEKSKYQRAKVRVAELKYFYNHVATYFVVNALLLLLRDHFTFVLLSKRVMGDPAFLDWIDWNLYGTPIIWGIGLCIHGIKILRGGSFFGQKWEERQLQKFIREDSEN